MGCVQLIPGFCSSYNPSAICRHQHSKVPSASLRMAKYTAWRQAHKEVTLASKGNAAQVIDMYLSPPTHIPVHMYTHSHKFLQSQRLAQTFPDILSLCPGAAPRMLPQIKVITSLSPRSCSENTHRTLQGPKTALTSTDDEFRSRTRVDMKCTCCFKMIDRTKAKTNYSPVDLGGRDHLHTFCLQFCRHRSVL